MNAMKNAPAYGDNAAHGIPDAPEDVMVISQWGCGNYYLEDKQTGEAIRISSEMYWEIIKRAQEIIKTVKENNTTRV